jgi:hypothetical protein
MEFRYSRWQTPRGARPDAVRGSDRYLIKNVTTLRLTYQVRLLTFAAEQDGGRLILRIPKACRLSADLRQFVAEHKNRLRAEWA